MRAETYFLLSCLEVLLSQVFLLDPCAASSILFITGETSKVVPRWAVVPKGWNKDLRTANYLLRHVWSVLSWMLWISRLSTVVLKHLACSESLEVVFPFQGLTWKQNLTHPCQVHLLVFREMLGRVISLMFWRSQALFLLCRASSIPRCQAGQEQGAGKCSQPHAVLLCSARKERDRY